MYVDDREGGPAMSLYPPPKKTKSSAVGIVVDNLHGSHLNVC